MQYENLCIFKSFATLGSSDVYFRKEAPSARCILESSDRCPNILTVGLGAYIHLMFSPGGQLYPPLFSRPFSPIGGIPGIRVGAENPVPA